jgi:hypothetical protein
MTDQTHSDQCWRQHLDCAVRRCEELERERDEARKLAEEWRDRWYNRSFASTLLPYPTLPWEELEDMWEVDRQCSDAIAEELERQEEEK